MQRGVASRGHSAAAGLRVDCTTAILVYTSGRTSVFETIAYEIARHLLLYRLRRG